MIHRERVHRRRGGLEAAVARKVQIVSHVDAKQPSFEHTPLSTDGEEYE
jgi:hypothetical protein